MKYEEESSDLKLEIGKLLADVEDCQEKLKTCEGEKADLVTSKLSLENEIKVERYLFYLQLSLLNCILISCLRKLWSLVMHLKHFSKP